MMRGTDMKIKQYLVLLFLMVSVTFGQINRSNWNSALIDAWSSPVGGLILNGVDQSASIPDNANLNFGTGDFSIELYFKTGDDVTSTQAVFAKDIDAYTTFILNSEIYTFIGGSGSVTRYPILANTLYSYIVTRTGATSTTYLQNINLGTTAIVGGDISNSIDLGIGDRTTSTPNPFVGIFYYAKLHNHALTQAEVTDRWNNGQPLDFVEPFETRDASNDVLIPQPLDFTSDWVGLSVGVVTANEFNTPSSAGGMYITAGIQLGKNYILRMIGTTDASSMRILTGSVGKTIKSGIATGAIDETIEFSTSSISGDGDLYIRADNASTTSFTTLTLTEQGNTLSLPYDKAGTNGWVGTLGGEVVVANTTGSPISPLGLSDGRSAIAATSVNLITSQKNNRLIEKVLIKNTGAATGTWAVGTTTGATDLGTGSVTVAEEYDTLVLNEFKGTGRDIWVTGDAATTMSFFLIYSKVD